MYSILWAFLSTLFLPRFLSDSSISFSNSLLAPLVWVALFLLLSHAKRTPIPLRTRLLTHLLGFLYALLTAYGYALRHLSSIPYLNPAFIASIILFAHPIAQALALLWGWMARKEALLCSVDSTETPSLYAAPLTRLSIALYRQPFVLFVLLLCCWLPCYLSTFPGNFVYDASYEYYQAADGYSRSYPLLHSFLITRLLGLSERWTGSVNVGIAAYTITQLLLAATLFSHILRHLYRRRIHPLFLLVLTAYWALFPAIHLLVTCTSRDILFGLLLTWTVYLYYRLASEPQVFFASKRNRALLAAVPVLTLLSRNNNSGPLALLLLLLFCALVRLLTGPKHLRHVLGYALLSFSLFAGISSGLEASCQPLYPSPPSSSMSLIAQPIVRTYFRHGDAWSEADRAAFASYFDLDLLEYFAQNADPAKGNLKVRYANMRPFLSFWIRMGLRYPACYLDALLAATQQMWFPDSVIDGYTVRETDPYYEKCYFYFGRYIEEIGTRYPLMPAVFRFYETVGLRLSFERIPVVSMLFSIGFHVWLLLHALVYTAHRRRMRLLVPLGILAVYVLCCAFIPLVLLRYFTALFFCFPLTLVLMLYPPAASPSSQGGAAFC